MITKNTITMDWALQEDIGTKDVTTNLLISKRKFSQGYIIVKEDAVLCGLDFAKKIFQRLDKRVHFRSSFKDGDQVPKNTKIIFLRGRTRALLTAERTALNFLSHLSGIATKTHSFIRAVKPYKAKILDTRKTIPGLRVLQKGAVRCAGGINHRMNLGEMVLIKDNHQAALGGKLFWKEIIANLRKKTRKVIEVEVDNLKLFKVVLEAHPDIILLDNMNVPQIRKAVLLARKLSNKSRPKLEVSGGVNLKNVSSIAKSGVDLISIGELTHSVKAIDMSLEITG